MKPLRVLLISHTCQSRAEGQPRAHALAAMPGLEVCVLVPRRWKRYGAWRDAQSPIEANFSFKIGRIVWPWSGPGQTYLHWYPGLPHLLRDFRPDVIDVWEEPWSAVSAQVCWWRDRLLPATRIVAETEQNIDKKLPPPFSGFRSYVFRRADFLVGRSDAALEVARRQGFGGPSRVVPNAVDCALFTPRGAKVEKPGGAFVVGYVGRLASAKGVEDLLRAVAACNPQVRLIVVGQGPFESSLKCLAAKLRIESQVDWLGARLPAELPALLRSFDCLVLPSRTTPNWKEQFGRVLIEAAACGVPTIGSSSGAIPGVIGAGERAMGLVFPEGDAAALTSAIETLRRDEELARRFGENGARRARAEFSWEQVAANLAAIYREVSAESEFGK